MFQNDLKNTFIIQEENTKEITVVLYVIKIICSCIYINFSFDFLGSDNV